MLKESPFQVIGRANVNEILLCALQDINVPVWHVSRLKRDACKMPDYVPSELRRLKSPAIYLAGRSCGLFAKQSPSNVDAVLRRGWDSNPRYRCQYTTFPGWPDQPLLHLSFLKNVRRRGRKSNLKLQRMIVYLHAQ